ncbi:MAG: hypothetical protein BAA00_15365 [Parageobacillus thermoglucosidasius]|nr:hypothetical protein [Parageobacillus thermoglucosidasius]OUM92475.1 MAG: hypothetical protein BAA00_15365 [Parageobacillus thermoglucosidasius]RDE29515.1 hypothetical protein DV714_00480 [Parageobacillus thermoglucosidasius]RDE36751.1 hypothetical protein DV713_00750 [Parageobacillus thermoglucosidasius]
MKWKKASNNGIQRLTLERMVSRFIFVCPILVRIGNIIWLVENYVLRPVSLDRRNTVFLFIYMLTYI